MELIIMTQEDDAIKQKQQEEDEFIKQHWLYLKMYPDKKKEELDGIFRLGDCDAFPINDKSRSILTNLCLDKYFELRGCPDDLKETSPPSEPRVPCFIFTGCGERYAKRLTGEM